MFEKKKKKAEFFGRQLMTILDFYDIIILWGIARAAWVCDNDSVFLSRHSLLVVLLQ